MGPYKSKDISEIREEYVRLLKKSVETLVNKLRDKVEKISIFGSYSRGKADLFTDLDIILIIKTDKPFLERMKEIYSLLALPVDADILCYTPEEYNRIRSRGFFKAMEEVVLYEKKGD